jgi:hypothetical protein
VTKKISEEKQELFVVEHAGTHLMLKKLIQHDKERLRKGEGTQSYMVMEWNVLYSYISSAIISLIHVFWIETKLYIDLCSYARCW